MTTTPAARAQPRLVCTNSSPPRPSRPKASPTTSTQAYTPAHRCRRVPKRSRTTPCKRRRLSTPSPCIPLRWRLPLGHPSSKPPTPHTLPSTQPCQHHRPMPADRHRRRPTADRADWRRHRRPQHLRAHFRPTARDLRPAAAAPAGPPPVPMTAPGSAPVNPTATALNQPAVVRQQPVATPQNAPAGLLPKTPLLQRPPVQHPAPVRPTPRRGIAYKGFSISSHARNPGCAGRSAIVRMEALLWSPISPAVGFRRTSGSLSASRCWRPAVEPALPQLCWAQPG